MKSDAAEPEDDLTPLPLARLTAISTEWSRLDNPAAFAIRYAPAIERYLRTLIGNEHDAAEVAQEFLLKVTQQGFKRVDQDRGRFRDYLIAAVRNAALTHLRRKKTATRRLNDSLEMLRPEATRDAADRAYQSEWQRCILEKAWRHLHRHERAAPGNLFYTVLKLSIDFPDEDSASLALGASPAEGVALRADAFRKQLSRARRRFAELIVSEVVETLDKPSPADVEAELAEIGLMAFVKPFLA